MKSKLYNDRRALAIQHTNDMSRKYCDEIFSSIENSIITQPEDELVNVVTSKYDTEIKMLKGTSTDAIVEECKTSVNVVAVLNFASYKYAGGGYLSGALAQEKCLCADSFLFNVLRSNKISKEFYSKNMSRLNNELYNNNLVFTPDVIFLDKFKCDVITCAAPNKGVAITKRGISNPVCEEAMRSRIESVLNMAYKHGIETLILGAFGCGVFKNDSLFVANTFKMFLDTSYKGVFKKVVFAIPDSKTYNTFKSVLLSD